MSGEMVLRQSAVNAIGADKLDGINNLGNRSQSRPMSGLASQPKVKAPDLNVWVVSPDQQPTMGPNDVVAAITDNINRRGALKTLIKQVSQGSF